MKRGTPDHPKLHTLAAILNLPRWGAVGVLESLWHFAQTYAQAGDVGRHGDEAIARAIGWQDNAATLISALVQAGWLDRCTCHRLTVHDWTHHADQTVQRWLKAHGQDFARCLTDPSLQASTVLAPDEPAVAVPCRAVAVPSPALPSPGAGEVPPVMPEGGLDPVKCPRCGALGSIRRSRSTDGTWYCSTREDGCGVTFAEADRSILAQQPKRIRDSILKRFEPPPMPVTPPEEQALYERRHEFVRDFRAWYAENPKAGCLDIAPDRSLPGVAFDAWRKTLAEPLPKWGADAVLREATAPEPPSLLPAELALVERRDELAAEFCSWWSSGDPTESQGQALLRWLGEKGYPAQGPVHMALKSALRVRAQKAAS